MARPSDIRVHLHAHELPAFARLRPLGDLDLQFPPGDKVFRRHAESRRCHLLRGCGDPLFFVVGVFPPLPAVAPSAKLPHREYHVALALGAHRTERHRPRAEPREDLLPGLHFHLGQRRSRRYDVEQVADVYRLGLPPHFHKLPVQILTRLVGDAVPHHPVDDRGAGCGHRVLFPHCPAHVLAELIRMEEPVRVFRVRRKCSLLQYVHCQLFVPDPAERRRDAREEVLHELAAESDRGKKLRAHVALHDGDPHLRHDLEETRLQRVQIVPFPDVGGEPAERLAVVVPDYFERKVRTDRRCAESYQRGDMVRRPCLPRMHDDGGLQPDSRFVEGADDRAQPDQTGNRRMFVVGRLVAQDNDARAPLDTLQHGGGKRIHGGPERPDTPLPLEYHREYQRDNVRLRPALVAERFNESHLS